MMVMDSSPATIIIGLVVLALAFLAARRLKRNGTCDCHKGSDDGGACSGGCGGCCGCGATDKMLSDMQRSVAKPVVEKL